MCYDYSIISEVIVVDLKIELKHRRKELGLTMLDIARMVGVSEGTISRWESGDIANMKRDKIVALANALQVTPAFIMGWEDEVSDKNVRAANTKKRVALHNGNSSPIPEISPVLADNYSKLNLEGQKKLIEYSDDLVTSGRYSLPDGQMFLAAHSSSPVSSPTIVDNNDVLAEKIKGAPAVTSEDELKNVKPLT